MLNTRSVLTRIIHERFCCNREFAAATSLHAALGRAGGRARRSSPQHTVSICFGVSHLHAPVSRGVSAVSSRTFSRVEHGRGPGAAHEHLDARIYYGPQRSGVSHIRSSNRTCGVPASGSRTSVTPTHAQPTPGEPAATGEGPTRRRPPRPRSAASRVSGLCVVAARSAAPDRQPHDPPPDRP